ncbi:hypothetical protein GEMRC1_005765 [Eukaryota sp. GEM-RC1]
MQNKCNFDTRIALFSIFCCLIVILLLFFVLSIKSWWFIIGVVSVYVVISVCCESYLQMMGNGGFKLFTIICVILFFGFVCWLLGNFICIPNSSLLFNLLWKISIIIVIFLVCKLFLSFPIPDHRDCPSNFLPVDSVSPPLPESFANNHLVALTLLHRSSTRSLVSVNNRNPERRHRCDFQGESSSDVSSLDYFKILKTLARSNLTTLLLGYHPIYKKVVIKSYSLKSKSFMSSNAIMLEKMNQNEVSIMNQVNHPNIVRLLHSFENEENNKRYLILEYVPGGALVSDSFITCQPLPVSSAWVYFRDLINALDYLHELNIVHRDIKPSNLLSTADGRAKLSDFGVSIDITANNRSSFALTGSSAFLAPELVSGYMDRAGKASDVWAAGVTLYFMVFGRLPFYDQQVMVVYRKICQDEPVFPQFIDPLLLNLLLSIFDKNPKTRITANELMTHPWIIHGPYNDSITVTDPEVVGEREKLLNRPTPSLQHDSSVHSLLEKAFAPLSIDTFSSSRSPSAFDQDDRKSPIEKFDLYDCLSARSIAFVSDVDWTDGESVGDFDSDFNLDV